MPPGTDRFVCNANGDAATFVTTANGTANDWGPWRLRVDDLSWQWLGPLELATRPNINIARDRDVLVAFVSSGLPRIARFRADARTPLPELPDLPAGTVLTWPAEQAAVGISPFGEGVLAWRSGS